MSAHREIPCIHMTFFKFILSEISGVQVFKGVFIYYVLRLTNDHLNVFKTKVLLSIFFEKLNIITNLSVNIIVYLTKNVYL